MRCSPTILSRKSVRSRTKPGWFGCAMFSDFCIFDGIRIDKFFYFRGDIEKKKEDLRLMVGYVRYYVANIYSFLNQFCAVLLLCRFSAFVLRFADFHQFLFLNFSCFISCVTAVPRCEGPVTLMPPLWRCLLASS